MDSSPGNSTAFSDEDYRIFLQDGSGLVQIGDVGKTFNLVAFGGDISSYRSYASLFRSAKIDRRVSPKKPWPRGEPWSMKNSAMASQARCAAMAMSIPNTLATYYSIEAI